MSLALVIGAGPTGMTAAIELKRLGMDVRIIDKGSHIARHSQALVVQARTLEQWQRYGIAEKAVERGRKLTEVKFWSNSKNLVSFELSAIPSRYPYVLFLPQTETEALLNEMMESLGVFTERGTELIAFIQKADGVLARIRHPDGSEEDTAARWLIGCDGARSMVRKTAGITFEGGGVGISFFLADLVLEGPDVPENELALHLHKGDVILLGRLSDKITRLIAAVHSKQDSHTLRELTIKDIQDAIDGAGVQVKVLSSEWMTPFRVNDLQAKHYRSDNVYLAGDASHIHSPVGGQGMNTGIQDIANLAWKLAAVEAGAPESLLDSYEEERAEVGRALLSFTERGLKMATTSNPVLEAARDLLIPHLTQLHAVQKRLLAFISELSINYRSSSIVSDLGGDGSLRAGDRMPDLAINQLIGQRSLLADWTQAEHLAVILNCTDSEIYELTPRLEGVPQVMLNGSQLDEEGLRLLGNDAKLLLVRPDGYVGFRGPVVRAAELEGYMQMVGLHQAIPNLEQAAIRTSRVIERSHLF